MIRTDVLHARGPIGAFNEWGEERKVPSGVKRLDRPSVIYDP